MFVDTKKEGEVQQEQEAWRKQLVDGADYIRKHGWCRFAVEDKAGRVCALGAFMKTGGCTSDSALIGQLALRNVINSGEWYRGPHPQPCPAPYTYGIAGWNNQSNRTVDEVIRAFEMAAVGPHPERL